MRTAFHALLIISCTIALRPQNVAAADSKPSGDTSRNEHASTPLDVARQKAEAGGRLYDEGRYAEAFEQLLAAHDVVPATTIKLLMARCQVKLGKLIEARILYRGISTSNLAPDAPPEFYEARRAAESELVVLEMQMPRIRLAIHGARGRPVRVTVDGSALSDLDTPLETNPGEHLLEVVAEGEAPVRRTVTGALGKTEEVLVDLTPELAPATTPKPINPSLKQISLAPADSRPSPGAPVPNLKSETRTSPMRMAAWASLAGGVAGVGLGAVTGIMALNKHADIASGCDGEHGCVETDSTLATNGKTLTTVSSASFAVGGAAALAGVIMFIASGNKAQNSSKQQRRWLPALHHGGIALRGVF